MADTRWRSTKQNRVSDTRPLHRQLPPALLDTLAWVIAAPGSTIPELSTLAGFGNPWTGAGYWRIAQLEHRKLVSTRRDRTRYRQPTVVYPTPLALDWHRQQWADPQPNRTAA